jgi:hypothetical protein
VQQIQDVHPVRVGDGRGTGIPQRLLAVAQADGHPLQLRIALGELPPQPIEDDLDAASARVLAVRLLRRDAPPELRTVLGASGTFAALSLIFDSPLIAAIILIEATGLGGPRLPLVLLPGLLAAGIGSLISIGMGSFTGLSTSAYALGALPLPAFARPDLADFAWTIPLAMAIPVVTMAIFGLARGAQRVVTARPFLLLPAAGLAVSGLAIAFSQASGKDVSEVLFSGQDALPGLIAAAGTWSLSALALLVAFKGVAWAVSLGSFRGGPTFPALFLGAAGGLMAAHLPGFDTTPAVAVGMGAGVASVLRLPLSAVVLAVLLTSHAGAGAGPLIVVGVVVAYVTTRFVAEPGPPQPARSDRAVRAGADHPAPAVAGDR